jgi:hypothetical protein
VTQHLYEWCSGFGSAALSIVNDFFASNTIFDDIEARKEFAESSLKSRAFLYTDTTVENVSYPPAIL